MSTVLAMTLVRARSAPWSERSSPPTCVRRSRPRRISTSPPSGADGSPSKASPIWFMCDGDAIYFTTVPTSYKAKRIAKGSPILVWVGSENGPHFVGKAELLRDPAVAEMMAPVYDKKYWISWLGFFRPRPTGSAPARRSSSGSTPLPAELVSPRVTAVRARSSDFATRGVVAHRQLSAGDGEHRVADELAPPALQEAGSSASDPARRRASRARPARRARALLAMTSAAISSRSATACTAARRSATRPDGGA